ncbi:MAG: NAD-dependent epimerase/dehydratase family protein [Deferribacterales bacterium]
MSKNVVIFGGSGFLGCYVAEELIKRGYGVTVADIRMSEYLPKKCVFVPCDILDRQKVSELITDDISYVYNFAGMANLDKAVSMPVETIESNIMGNLNILEGCRDKNIDRYVYASSAYALSDKGSFYGVSKLASEKLTEEYFRAYGLKFTIIRYGSVYGERAYENNYLYSVLKSAITDKKIVHDRDGQEVREYIHAQDAAVMSADIIESEKYANEHIILTGIERMKRVELFIMIKEILNNEVDIKLNHELNDHHYKITPYSFHPSVCKKLVPNPYIDMGQGILDCIKEIHSQGEED